MSFYLIFTFYLVSHCWALPEVLVYKYLCIFTTYWSSIIDSLRAGGYQYLSYLHILLMVNHSRLSLESTFHKHLDNLYNFFHRLSYPCCRATFMHIYLIFETYLTTNICILLSFIHAESPWSQRLNISIYFLQLISPTIIVQILIRIQLAGLDQLICRSLELITSSLMGRAPDQAWSLSYEGETPSKHVLMKQ